LAKLKREAEKGDTQAIMDLEEHTSAQSNQQSPQNPFLFETQLKKTSQTIARSGDENGGELEPQPDGAEQLTSQLDKAKQLASQPDKAKQLASQLDGTEQLASQPDKAEQLAPQLDGAEATSESDGADFASEPDEILSNHSDVFYNNFELQELADEYENGAQDTEFNSDLDGWEHEDCGFGSEDEPSSQ
jgi:hypothetical protein